SAGKAVCGRRDRIRDSYSVVPAGLFYRGSSVSAAGQKVSARTEERSGSYSVPAGFRYYGSLSSGLVCVHEPDACRLCRDGSADHGSAGNSGHAVSAGGLVSGAFGGKAFFGKTEGKRTPYLSGSRTSHDSGQPACSGVPGL